MRRAPRIALLAALAASGVAFAVARGPDEGSGRDVKGARGEVVDLLAAGQGTARPQEDVSGEDLAAVERHIKRSGDAASPDDGISPGAPSDAEVRRALRQLEAEIAAGPVRRGSGDLIWPINGPLTSPFGMRWGRLHAGIDIAAATGTPIRAAASGRVILMAPTGGYGNYTCLRHRAPVSTCYAHQSRFGTSLGASVRQGDVIGFVGNTGHSFGNHLHFEVRIDGRPVDPRDYL